MQRSAEHLQAFRVLLAAAEGVGSGEIERIAEIDFRFHPLISLATGNRNYALLLNSFRQVYMSLTKRFFSDPGTASVVFGLHRGLVQAIEDKHEKEAMETMRRLLVHGRDRLRAMMEEGEEERGQP